MKSGTAITVATLVVVAVAGSWLAAQHGKLLGPQRRSPPASTGGAHLGTAPPKPPPAAHGKPAGSPATTKAPAAHAGFCQRDFSDVAARKADVPRLQQAGGVVHIFEHAAHPYRCAAFYLGHGLDINAADPRPDHGDLTGLEYAIKRNNPKMVRFMIHHGANLQERAGSRRLKPYGYAVYLAFHDRNVDRNPVISILDKALTAAADQQGKNTPAGQDSRADNGPR